MSKASNAPSAETITAEVWRAIPGWPYEVSDRGRVRRGGRVLSPRVSEDGYARVSLSNRRVRSVAVATLVAEAFLGPRPRNHQVNHKNGAKADNRIENLEYVTAAENIRHAVRHGLFPVGERNGQSKLSVMLVRVLRHLGGRVPAAYLAGLVGVNPSTIQRAMYGRHWGSALRARAPRKETDDA